MTQQTPLLQGETFTINRRKFILASLSGITAVTLPAAPFNFSAGAASNFKAIAFDAFPIFDPRPVFSLAENIFPGHGSELSNAWRTSQFEYCWLRTTGGQYRNFWQVTEDALTFAAKKTGLTLSADNKKQLMEKYLALDTWPDVLPALQTFKKNGIRLSFLSNMTAQMLSSSARHASIESYFEQAISTDQAATYKPGPAAYRLGTDLLQLKKEEILFVAFAGWDAAGAKWFGYPTFWLNRSGAPAEELNAIPDGTGKNMQDLVNFLQLSS